MINCLKPKSFIGICCIGLLPIVSVADELSSNQPPANKSDYEIEEMVVTAQQPDWRKPSEEQDWRPKRFELPEEDVQRKMEWFPEYTRDERDNYDQVRNPLNEKPDFQIFKWKF
jgi:hypothetical protein